MQERTYTRSEIEARLAASAATMGGTIQARLRDDGFPKNLPITFRLSEDGTVATADVDALSTAIRAYLDVLAREAVRTLLVDLFDDEE